MLRLVFLGPSLLLMMLAAPFLLGGGMSAPIFGGLLVGSVVLSFGGYRLWVDRRRPASDTSRLRAYLEVDHARVVSIRPDGVVVRRSNGPDWRKYVAVVRLADGAEVTRSLGVEVSLLGYPAICDYDRDQSDGALGRLF